MPPHSTLRTPYSPPRFDRWEEWRGEYERRWRATTGMAAGLTGAAGLPVACALWALGQHRGTAQLFVIAWTLACTVLSVAGVRLLHGCGAGAGRRPLLSPTALRVAAPAVAAEFLAAAVTPWPAQLVALALIPATLLTIATVCAWRTNRPERRAVPEAWLGATPPALPVP